MPEKKTIDPVILQMQMMDYIAKHFKDNSIEIIVSQTGIPSIKILDGSDPASWKFLEEMSQLLSFPITRLALTEKRNFDLLLEFVKRHPNLHSLDLGPSQDIDDKKLEELAKNLNKIISFVINNAIITTIPFNISNRVKELDGSDCIALKKLYAPQAERLDCVNCTGLTKLYASQVERLDCRNCPALIELRAPKAKTLICGGCLGLARRGTRPNGIPYSCQVFGP